MIQRDTPFRYRVRSNLARLALSFFLFAGAVVGEARAESIQEARYASIGGIEQWITIRGSNRSNPVLLFLHGGPGDTLSTFVSTFAPLERAFTVVQWDQRGAGKTLSRAGSIQSTSLEQLTSDGIELTEYLKTYLHSRRVILVGHSWGSYLGIRIVTRRPDLFRAFVGTGQIVSWKGTIETLYRITLERARAEPNPPAVKELEALGVPAPDRLDQYWVMRKRLNAYIAKSDEQWLQGAISAATPEEFKTYGAGIQASMQNSLASLAPALFSIDVPALGYDFPIPFYIIQGQDDLFTPTSLAIEYFNKVKAPRKHLTVIAGSGHFAAMTHMRQFAQALEKDVESLPP